jgi:hypothetical protein
VHDAPHKIQVVQQQQRDDDMQVCLKCCHQFLEVMAIIFKHFSENFTIYLSHTIQNLSKINYFRAKKLIGHLKKNIAACHLHLWYLS